MKPTFFSNPLKFREWLKKHHADKTELLVGFYKVTSGKASMTWPQSVDEALCFGWIDGIRRSIDEESYTIRFTPRRPTSIWSTVNIKKMNELSEKGLMQAAGLEVFKHRKEERSEVYSHEHKARSLDKKLERQFKANKKAWKFFQSMAPSYRKAVINWLMSAKQEATRLRRLEELIRDSEAGRKIKQMDYR
jgi:uncharacterized protein YdeI (YjbR/CyaY-like superfamily)